MQTCVVEDLGDREHDAMMPPNINPSRRRAAGFVFLILIGVLKVGNVIAEQVRFERISLEQGLSQNSVVSILQDRQGFMWFGTQDGLNRYDGYRFRVFKHDPDNPVSLGNNYIQTLYEDRDGVLWIGTRGGILHKFNRRLQFVN